VGRVVVEQWSWFGELFGFVDGKVVDRSCREGVGVPFCKVRDRLGMVLPGWGCGGCDCGVPTLTVTERF
jgi:hypothetical protein